MKTIQLADEISRELLIILSKNKENKWIYNLIKAKIDRN